MNARTASPPPTGVNRLYDPTTAQFTTLDPLVAVTEEPYGYTGGNPANGSDPTGLWGIRIGPVKIGNDGCVLGTNPNGSCRGSDVENVVKTVNKASGVVAAGAGVCTAAGAVSLIGAPVAAACAPVAAGAAAVNLGTGFALTATGSKSPASLIVDLLLAGTGQLAQKGALRAGQYALQHQRTGGLLHMFGIPTFRQWMGELGEVALWSGKAWIDVAPLGWEFGSWLGLGDSSEC